MLPGSCLSCHHLPQTIALLRLEISNFRALHPHYPVTHSTLLDMALSSTFLFLKHAQD
jgi:hypothetical protein